MAGPMYPQQFPCIVTLLALVAWTASAQQETDDAEEDAEENKEVLEEIIVTGTRLGLNPTETSGNVVVLNSDNIEISGEVTLDRVLRQLPQNTNGTTTITNSSLNGAINTTAGATVNLRGLGSEATLILIDGRRIGSHGVTGGITDISSIPISMVERVEVLLEGASAIYGADAVGGVVNIILRKDYETITASIDYSEPSAGGNREAIYGLNGGFGWNTGGFRFGLQFQDNDGLQAAHRDLTLPYENANRNQFNTGPQIEGLDIGTGAPYFYRGPSNNITIAAYNALPAAEQANYTPVAGFSFPEEFDGDINTISDFSPIEWPNEIKGQNRNLLPVQERLYASVGFDQDIGDLEINLDASYAQRDVMSLDGNAQLFQARWSPRNPFNPFGVLVFLNGWTPGFEIPRATASEADELNTDLRLAKSFGQDYQWSWEVTVGQSHNEGRSDFFGSLDLFNVNRGIFSDGVTPGTNYFQVPGQVSADDCMAQGGALVFGGIFCRVLTPPPMAIDPFNADYSQYLLSSTFSESVNGQKRVEALLRGESFDLPGGPIKLLFGASWREDRLRSEADSGVATPLAGSPIEQVFEFESDASREQRALFLEGYIPFVSSLNARPGIDRLGVNFSVRWDDYASPAVSRYGSVVDNLCEGDGSPAGITCDTEYSDVSHTLGAVYNPIDERFGIRVNYSTAFVAPQLNQTIAAPMISIAPFDLRFPMPPGGCPEGTRPFGSAAAPQCALNLFARTSGNPTLNPESSDTFSIGIDFMPQAFEGLSSRITWSRLDTKDRIYALRTRAVDAVDVLPGNMTRSQVDFDYFTGVPSPTPVTIFTEDRRALNIAAVVREGVDLFLNYGVDTEVGAFDATINYARVLGLDVTVDVMSGEETSIVGSTNTPPGTAPILIPPVPEDSLNVQLGWSLRGLSLSANVSYQSEVRTIRGTRTGGTSTIVSQAPTLVNVSLGYTFDDGSLFDTPDFLNGTVLTFRVTNVMDDFTKSQFIRRDADGSISDSGVQDLNPLTTYAIGRLFGLNISKRF